MNSHIAYYSAALWLGTSQALLSTDCAIVTYRGESESDGASGAAYQLGITFQFLQDAWATKVVPKFHRNDCGIVGIEHIGIGDDCLQQRLSQLSRRGLHIYICGPSPMMDATCALLRKVGVPEDFILTEAFLSPMAVSSVNVSQQATDDADSAVTESVIEFSKSRVVTTSMSDSSVLEAAEAAGVDIPYECRSGICGQCKVRLLQGQVRMDSEDALSPSEKANGFILTCQAHAKTPLVVDA